MHFKAKAETTHEVESEYTMPHPIWSQEQVSYLMLLLTPNIIVSCLLIVSHD